MLNILVFVNIGTVNISIVTLKLLNIYIFSKFFSFFQKLFHPGSIVPKNIKKSILPKVLFNNFKIVFYFLQQY